ncbi:hypothetical protein C8R44DRAFT_799177 [Mycena epipterygia]|nr:hypothetical protein C8R44DRAFT_799177 [Mycena epipterygia]
MRNLHPALATLVVAGLRLVRAQQHTLAVPGVIPLAVRSPALNAWMPTVDGAELSTKWPEFWTGERILGWAGMVMVDGVAWQWLGQSGSANSTTWLRTQITATRSILSFTAGPVELNVTFLSPIEPVDLVKQSLPFTYLYVDAASTDGHSHSIQFYSDISAEWASGDSGSLVQWSTNTTENIAYHQVHRQSPQPMSEINDMAEDGVVYYAMGATSGSTWQIGADVDVRSQFVQHAKLTDTGDTSFRAINDKFPVFAHSLDLGNITSTSSSPPVWAIGIARDPSITFAAGTGSTQARRAYFWTKYKSIADAIHDFLADFPAAVQRAQTLDDRIVADTAKVSANYTDLAALVARQTLGATEITVPGGSNDPSDVKMFMEDIGWGQRVNPVETIYAAFPLFLYLNPDFAGLLLKPLLQSQAGSAAQARLYAAPDIGPIYPLATGNNDSTAALGVDNSGSMLIMVLAHARFSGDGTLVAEYYSLLKGWADYLVANTLDGSGQISSDAQGIPGLNRSGNAHLAVKGIIAVTAMSQISEALGNVGDKDKYLAAAEALLERWESQAISSGHVLSTLNDTSSAGLVYDLFADQLLKTGVFNQTVQTYANQTAFYSSQVSGATPYGLPLSTDSQGKTRSDWLMFTAATTTSNATRDQLIAMAHARAFFNQTGDVFPVLYDVRSGNTSSMSGQASPAQGAVFALLSLDLATKTISIPPRRGSDTGAIVGGTLGASVTLVVLAVVTESIRRARRRRKFLESQPQTLPLPYDLRPTDLHVVTDLATPAPVARTARDKRGETPAEASAVVGGTAVSGDVREIWSEVGNLRREMEEIRLNRERHGIESPPPGYDNL